MKTSLRFSAALVSTALYIAIITPGFAEDAMTTDTSTSTSASTTTTPLTKAQKSMMIKNAMQAKVKAKVTSDKKSSVRKDGSGKMTNGTCVVPFVKTREDSIIAAAQAMSSAWVSARTTLSTDLQAAFTANDNSKRMSAWKTYRASVKTARMTNKDAVKKAWESFKTGVKTCNEAAATADASAEASADQAE